MARRKRVVVRGLPLAHGPVALPALTLTFDTLPPDFEGNTEADLRGWLRVARIWYREHAATMIDALEKHVPQGFTDALFAEMAARQASVLRVAKARK